MPAGNKSSNCKPGEEFENGMKFLSPKGGYGEYKSKKKIIKSFNHKNQTSTMFKNYFKIAWRNLIKNKVYSIINILGLAAGMAVAMLIALWIWDEVTFDNYHTNHKQLAQVMTTFFDDKNEQQTGQAVAIPIGNDLRTKYASDFKNVSLASWNFSHVLAVGEKNYTQWNVG